MNLPPHTNKESARKVLNLISNHLDQIISGQIKDNSFGFLLENIKAWTRQHSLIDICCVECCEFRIFQKNKKLNKEKAKTPRNHLHEKKVKHKIQKLEESLAKLRQKLSSLKCAYISNDGEFAKLVAEEFKKRNLRISHSYSSICWFLNFVFSSTNSFEESNRAFDYYLIKLNKLTLKEKLKKITIKCLFSFPKK